MHNDLVRQNDDATKSRTTQGSQSKTKSHSTQATSKTAHKPNMKDENMDSHPSSRSSRK
ncbi:MAG TPA: hypothetical protein VK705_04735 [Ferruginibacter sp.]|nr:hypothetical protein [Ferruginibacter sp.]